MPSIVGIYEQIIIGWLFWLVQILIEPGGSGDTSARNSSRIEGVLDIVLLLFLLSCPCVMNPFAIHVCVITYVRACVYVTKQ